MAWGFRTGVASRSENGGACRREEGANVPCSPSSGRWLTKVRLPEWRGKPRRWGTPAAGVNRCIVSVRWCAGHARWGRGQDALETLVVVLRRLRPGLGRLAVDGRTAERERGDEGEH